MTNKDLLYRLEKVHALAAEIGMDMHHDNQGQIIACTGIYQAKDGTIHETPPKEPMDD